MSTKAASQSAPKKQLGTNWTRVGKAPDLIPSGLQTAFTWDKEAQRHADTASLRALFRAAMEAAGGIYWLASSLDKPLSYASRVSEAVNAIGDRKVQLDWIPPLFQDEKAKELLVSWICDRCGYEQPALKKQSNDADELEAYRELSKTAGLLGEAIRNQINKKLGKGLL